MKRIYILISLIILSIISVNIFYYLDVYKQQLNFQKNLIFQQVEICGSDIEEQGYQFQSEMNYILFSDDIASIFNDEEVKRRGLLKLQLFYSEYEELIESIKIYDTNYNVYSLFKDIKGRFINDYYISQKQRKLLEKEKLIEEEGDYFFCMPVFKENEVYGNIVVKLNFVDYFNTVFERYHLGNSLWQWLVDEHGVVLSQNLIKDTIQITRLDAIISNLKDDYDGFIKHSVISNNRENEIISAFYSVRLLSKDYGIVFSLMTDTILKIIIRKTIIISALSFLLLILTIVYFIHIVRRKNNEIKNLKNEQDSLNEIIANLPIGLIILNKDKTIKNINKTAENLLFLKSDESLIGKNISERFLIPKNYLRDDESDDLVFDSNQFIYYEKDETEVVLYKKEIPLVINKEEYTLEAFIDVTPLEKSRKLEATANNAKSDFLAKMSHEIRTPMNGIIGMTDALLNQELTDQQIEFVKIIKKSADLLLAIINDILDFSKIEAGKMKLEEIPFKLSDEIKLTLELFRPIAAEKKVEIKTKVPDNVHDNILGDPFRLRQVLSNLVGNAVKFTHEGEIMISVNQVEEYSGNITLLFTIEDTGIGIPKDKINTIFTSFAQADGSTSRKYGGTGLGTTICKQLVDLMNGEIWVESPSSISKNSKYPGSKFSFTIEVFSNEKIEKNYDFSSITRYDQINILLVNKKGNYEENILSQYRKLGINITHLDKENALKELEKTREKNEVAFPYHIVIIRDNITFDGFEVAKKLYKDKLHLNFILAIFSSNDKTGNFVRSKRTGVDYYLIKPYNPNEIINIIKDNFKSIMDKRIHVIKKLRENISILVAEDNIINQKVAQTIFNNLGYKIEIARDGYEVIEKVNQQDFDIIFMDLLMPGKDGMETTIELRGKGISIPIVAMTASAHEQNEKKAISVGMNDYLVKPVKVETVKNLLTKWFSEEESDL